jgi:hypothetical protein
MTSANELVTRYFDLWARKEFAATLPLMSSETFCFRGPFDTFSRPEELIEALQKLAPIVKGVRKRRQIAEGREVCLSDEMETCTPAGTVEIVELFRVEQGKISSIQAFFDPRPFQALFAACPSSEGSCHGNEE